MNHRLINLYNLILFAKLKIFINKLNLENKRFAVEVNQLIVPMSEHHSYTLANNDRVEIVEAVGGG